MWARKLMIVVSFMLMSFVLLPNKRPLKIYLIGDSTMCTYEPKQFPVRGWGMPFATFFVSDVTIDNRAKGGRSTRTFISENRWKTIADSLQEGNYVFIQFGHNDEAKEPQYADRYTPVEDYRKNLIRFITEARSKKAIPVLITPVTRMKFDREGKIMETHAEYSKAVTEAAKEYKTPLIDLDAKSRELLQQLGADNAKLLFNHLEPGEHPNYPAGIKDNTHFNEYGARRIAELVLAEIRRLNLNVVEHIYKSVQVKK